MLFEIDYTSPAWGWDAAVYGNQLSWPYSADEGVPPLPGLISCGDAQVWRTTAFRGALPRRIWSSP